LSHDRAGVVFGIFAIALLVASIALTIQLLLREGSAGRSSSAPSLRCIASRATDSG
jgi:hypothetical protein